MILIKVICYLFDQITNRCREEGDRRGTTCKFFFIMFIVFNLSVFLWYFLNTNFIPFFVSLAETPQGQARTDEPDATPLRGVQAGKSFLLSFVLYSLVYMSSLFSEIHFYLVKCRGEQNVSSSRLSFFVSNLLACTHH